MKQKKWKKWDEMKQKKWKKWDEMKQEFSNESVLP